MASGASNSMDGNPKQEVAEKLRNSSSVLVTVSKNPSVDQLASALGLSLMLDKLGKHTTTVFSGDIPNTMEFLDPDRTFDKTVDGLRDFIISLDKEKADKLRYKVEDNVVKIYITPYKSKITQDDLEFSQGDFNVDLVVALGVHERNDLDEAITSHGRILHDATIVTINDEQGKGKEFGAVDWTQDGASCLSEMLVSISEALEGGILDKQMSTAFLTGIVAATERFKNDKTTPKLMTMAAQLMAAGANQQQIAKNLVFPGMATGSDEGPREQNPDNFAEEGKTDVIEHDEPKQDESQKKKDSKDVDTKTDNLEDIEQAVQAKHNQLNEEGRTVRIDDEDPAIQALEDDLSHDSSSNLLDLEGRLKTFDPNAVEQETEPQQQPPSQQQLPPEEGPIGHAKSLDSSAFDPEDRPSMGGTFNATAEQAHESAEADRANARNKSILSHKPIDGQVDTHGRDLRPGGDVGGGDMPSSEELMHDLQEARKAVEDAMNESASFDTTPHPIQALNANPVDLDDTGGDFNLSNNNVSQMNPLNQQPQVGPPPPMQQSPIQPPPQQSGPPMPQQMFMPQQNNNGGGMNTPPQQMQMPQQSPLQPPAPFGQGGVAPTNGNPMFNTQPPLQQFPTNGSPFNNGTLGAMPPQENGGPMNLPSQDNGNGNGMAPPPMPPNAPPPMPPFN